MHLFESLIEPAAALTVIPAAAATRSHRYGGLPGLPDGTDWPTYAGTPMVLLARLDCADLAALLSETWTLPRTGELLFFHEEPFTTGPQQLPYQHSSATGRFGAPSTPGQLGALSTTADRFGEPSTTADRFGDSSAADRFEDSSATGRFGDSSAAGRFGDPRPSAREEPSTADRLEDPRLLLRDGSAADRFADAHDDGCRVLHVPAGLPPRPAPPGTWVVPALCLAADRVGSVPPYDAPALAHVFALDPVAAMTARERAEDTAGRPPRHQVLGWQRDAFLHLPGLRPLLQLEAEPGTAWGEVVNVSFWLPEADLAAGRLTAARRYLEVA
ncbi:DUF1963 domain-containing protein [Dactylosporangium sp. NPDC000521]|uniref:DUF1963 domain-containing protein n=1 Tax=Dactylosporangium sp. NPDC000521 TaxID=3363975 RepID=UPI0036CEDE7A